MCAGVGGAALVTNSKKIMVKTREPALVLSTSRCLTNSLNPKTCCASIFIFEHTESLRSAS